MLPIRILNIGRRGHAPARVADSAAAPARTPVRSLRRPRPLFGLICWCVLSSAASAENYRFVFLGPTVPLLIEAEISAGNWDQRQVRQQYAAGVFRRLDLDQDGWLSPAEAIRIPATGRFSAQGGELGDRWQELDTNPADERISPDELRTFIEQALGPALAVVKAPRRLAETVRLFDELDLDRDGRITAAELTDGLERLRRSDFDDDETLSVAELQPFPLSIVRARQQAAEADAEQVPLIALASATDRETAAARLIAARGAGRSTIDSAEELGVLERFFRAFDADRDGKLNTRELAGFLEKAPPSLTLKVTLAPPGVQIVRLNPTAQHVRVLEEGRRPTLELAGVPVELVARNRLSDARDQLALYKTRAMVADTDMNGYLDETEFLRLEAGGVMFTDVDLDQNGEVTREELDLFFSLDLLAAQSQLVATVSNEAKVLFNMLDTDSDLRLSPRELQAAPEILRQLDLDGDGAFSAHELTSRYRITFSQPELIEIRPLAQMNTTARTGATREATSGPVWFRRMDRNLDGELTWREFLGSREQFEQLDLNSDGLISLNEAEQAESLRAAR